MHSLVPQISERVDESFDLAVATPTHRYVLLRSAVLLLSAVDDLQELLRHEGLFSADGMPGTLRQYVASVRCDVEDIHGQRHHLSLDDFQTRLLSACKRLRHIIASIDSVRAVPLAPPARRFDIAAELR